MKSTDHFKRTIEGKLNEIAAIDAKFAESLKKENKNIDNCITYILNTVQKSGCNGFTDDEVYGMAIHYYDEDNIETVSKINCNVIVNHSVELTQEEIEEAKKEAKEKLISAEMERLRKKQTVKKEETKKTEQQSLF